FNDSVDKYTTKPVAQAYNKVMPSVLNTGVSNVFSNGSEVTTSVNSVLQGKVKNAGVSVSRLLVNSTLGMGGLFDVASKLGLESSKEDFSQTLGVWGVKKGSYIVLPLMGSTTTRGLLGKGPDYMTSPSRLIDPTSVRDKASVLGAVNSRAGLLEAEKMVIGERYDFIRDIYMNQVDVNTHGKALETDDDDF
ncbi:MAG: VacJ family lipoprotein, partial [Pseudomonadota bacterium]